MSKDSISIGKHKGKLQVCEFYSGIGGYHLALSKIPDLSFDVAAAFEISSNANLLYRHNFPQTKVLETNLCGLTAKKLDTIMSCKVSSTSSQVDDSVISDSCDQERRTMFCMSPPCQPYSRQGSFKDNSDNRAESVQHLFSIFSDLTTKPDYFFLENVRGFERSETRENIIEFLKDHNYHMVEFLLNSNSLGIPNSRLRYYLLARKTPFPELLQSSVFHSEIPGLEEIPEAPLICTFLEDDPQGYELSEKVLSRWGWVLDLVAPGDTRSCCFTKGYCNKAEGSGSVLQQNPSAPSNDNTDLGTERNDRSVSGCKLEGEEFLVHMKSLKLRYFTPREIARIHGIPEWFSIPAELSTKQMYKLLGNGLNVTVVKLLIQHVLLK